jgi:hypothetical protein
MGVTQDLLSFSSHRRGLLVCGFATFEYMCGKWCWKSVWYMVSMRLCGMYSCVCHSAIAGRELLCKICPSSLRICLVGLHVSLLCNVEKMLIIDYWFRVWLRDFCVCEHSITAVLHTIMYCSLSIASMFSHCTNIILLITMYMSCVLVTVHYHMT